MANGGPGGVSPKTEAPVFQFSVSLAPRDAEYPPPILYFIYLSALPMAFCYAWPCESFICKCCENSHLCSEESRRNHWDVKKNHGRSHSVVFPVF